MRLLPRLLHQLLHCPASPAAARHALLAVDSLATSPAYGLLLLQPKLLALPAPHTRQAALQAAAQLAQLLPQGVCAVLTATPDVALLTALHASSAALFATLGSIHAAAALSGDAHSCRLLSELASANLYHSLLATRRIGGLLAHTVALSPSPHTAAFRGGRIEALELRDVLLQAVVDVEAVAVEKYGVCPPIRVEGQACCYGQHGPLSHALTELLKNAVAATVAKYRLDADQAPPVTATLSADSDQQLARLEIRNHGPTLTPEDARRALRFFHTTATQREPNYTFSSDFGGSLQGLGLGLKYAVVEAEVWGGGLKMRGLEDGVVVEAVFRLAGDSSVQQVLEGNGG